MEVKNIKKELKDMLDKSRYEHTIGVSDTAACLAMAYGIDVNKAYLAGLLHDCAKCIDDKKKIKECKENNINLSEYEIKNPSLIHSKLGVVYAKNKFNISDEEILSAICFHTTGKPNMTLLEQIIFVSDYIEPLRDKAPDLDLIRALAFADIDVCTYKILKDTLEYLENKENVIDEQTKITYDFYKKKLLDGGYDEEYIKNCL